MSGGGPGLPYGVARLLHILSQLIGMIAGVGLFFVFLGWVQPRIPDVRWMRITAFLGSFVLLPLSGVFLLSSWAYFVPTRCPRCRGRARYRRAERFFEYSFYACAACGREWRPGRGDGFNG